MFSASPCRAVYRLDFPLLKYPTRRLYHPAATIHFASYSTKVSPSNTNAQKAAVDSVRNNATVAPNHSAKPSIIDIKVPEDAFPHDRLNPPPSSLPPPLTLPTRQPDQPAYKYYYTLGRAYLTFYKTGLKNLYTNYKLTRILIARHPSSQPLEQSLLAGALTRADWLTIRRTRADLARLPLFALVFCICGEFTPLVVLAVSGAVPRSLWIPMQVESARRKVEERRNEVFRNPDPALGLEAEMKGGKVEEMGQPVMVHIGRSLGLYSSLWDRLGVSPTSIVRRRVKRRMEFVELDDAVIERDGGVENLDGEEVVMAAENRGIDVSGRKEADLKMVLEEWLQARKALMEKGKAATWLYLTRPAAWPRAG